MKNTAKTKRVSGLISVLCLVLVLSMTFVLASCKKDDDSGENTPYEPEYQKETTILSTYYQQDEQGRILPTSSDRHDIEVIEGGGANANELQGEWMLGEHTTYIFDGVNRGILLTGVDNYTFVYSAQDGKLRIDIDVKNGEDIECAYSIDGDTMTWNRTNGQVHTLKRVEQ